eukprot:NODE_13_length_42895_cov_0.518413.p17 type:complete len:222 gc:universal NODE_13_length_42895_cov_0.518413:35320-34655(-)
MIQEHTEINIKDGKEEINWMHFDVNTTYQALSCIPKLYIPKIVYDYVPKKQFTLVLDMDECLLHCRDPVTLDSSARPFVKEFLEEMSYSCDLILFTSAEESYAKAVLDILDLKKYFTLILTRKHCYFFANIYFKLIHDIIAKGTHVIAVDNTIHNFGYNLQNAIPIKSFMGEKEDKALLWLRDELRIIISLADKDQDFDCSEYIQQRFQVLDLILSIENSI